MNGIWTNEKVGHVDSNIKVYNGLFLRLIVTSPERLGMSASKADSIVWRVCCLFSNHSLQGRRILGVERVMASRDLLIMGY